MSGALLPIERSFAVLLFYFPLIRLHVNRPVRDPRGQRIRPPPVSARRAPFTLAAASRQTPRSLPTPLPEFSRGDDRGDARGYTTAEYLSVCGRTRGCLSASPVSIPA